MKTCYDKQIVWNDFLILPLNPQITVVCFNNNPLKHKIFSGKSPDMPFHLTVGSQR